jgi:hypothetical protein
VDNKWQMTRQCRRGQQMADDALSSMMDAIRKLAKHQGTVRMFQNIVNKEAVPNESSLDCQLFWSHDESFGQLFFDRIVVF